MKTISPKHLGLLRMSIEKSDQVAAFQIGYGVRESRFNVDFLPQILLFLKLNVLRHDYFIVAIKTKIPKPWSHLKGSIGKFRPSGGSPDRLWGP